MSSDNKLHLSWHDSAWIPILQPSNVLEYFSQRSNPFYDRTCNNEVVRMQRRDLSSLKTMTGLEYELLHVQGTFLYIVRKQFRRSPTEVTPQANYYILNGIVYQAPDLHAIINSRAFSALYHITKAFDEVLPRSRYHPTSGYLWDFEHAQLEDYTKKEATVERSSHESHMQHRCIGMILADVANRFPPQYMTRDETAALESKTAPASASAAENLDANSASTPATTTEAAGASTEVTSAKRAPADVSEEAPAAKRPKLV